MEGLHLFGLELDNTTLLAAMGLIGAGLAKLHSWWQDAHKEGSLNDSRLRRELWEEINRLHEELRTMKEFHASQIGKLNTDMSTWRDEYYKLRDQYTLLQADYKILSDKYEELRNDLEGINSRK